MINNNRLLEKIILWTLFMIFALIMNVACTEVNEGKPQYESLTGYPSDILARQTQDGYNLETEIFNYGFNDEDFKGEVYQGHGRIGFTHPEDTFVVFSNEAFSQDFYYQHKVEFPKSFMIPTLSMHTNVDYGRETKIDNTQSLFLCRQTKERPAK